MAYRPEPFVGAPTGTNVHAYLQRELSRIAAELEKVEQGQYFPVLGAAPAKPREGQLAYGAAGVLGANAGFYQYRSGAWVAL